ncbi:MAG TPA: phenylalanine--tRNA ligase subunit alpha [Myxococcota bacterium]|nr:phenylalanine--tRNA ligase subunit alpha [Myxococcota bacterium]
MSDLAALRDEATTALSGAADLRSLETLRVRFLGKKGAIKALQKKTGQLPPEERKGWGMKVNALVKEVTSALEARKEQLERAAQEAALEAGWIDPTLPTPRLQGGLHPITKVLMEVVDHFHGLGYEVASGPEIEDAFHNFDALNIPANHPARDVWDTFYLTTGEIPRTHTSSVQIRTLESRQPPLRIIAPGKCFRNETIDATHLAAFNQCEGLYIDRDVTVGHLKATLEGLVERLMGRRVPTRFRPAFYPFVEPGLDLDIECIFCLGDGCSICKDSGWIEVIPCGMVHPNVLRACGHDPDEWNGFAFGMGFDRMVMLRYGIDDLRRLYDGNLDLVRKL